MSNWSAGIDTDFKSWKVSWKDHSLFSKVWRYKNLLKYFTYKNSTNKLANMANQKQVQGKIRFSLRFKIQFSIAQFQIGENDREQNYANLINRKEPSASKIIVLPEIEHCPQNHQNLQNFKSFTDIIYHFTFLFVSLLYTRHFLFQ